jgi:mannose-6-phosphate isomerase-like protein (cupin superfamily)
MASLERIEVVDGTIKLRLGRRTIVAKAGEVILVRAGKRHKIENAGFQPAQLQIRLCAGSA